MSSISDRASPDFHIVDFSGPLFIAGPLHWGLFGILSIQLYLYYQAFPNDRSRTKCLVYTVYAIESVQTILLTYDAFMVFGNGFGDLATLTKVYFDWMTVPVMSGLGSLSKAHWIVINLVPNIVAFIGQSFYAYRIHVLSKSWFIPWLIVAISLTSSVGAFITGVLSFEAGNIALLNNRKTSVAVGVWCGASALSDLIIAVYMTYYVNFLAYSSSLSDPFKLSKYDTGFRQTHILVSKLIRLIIETGTLTAMVVLTGLALFFAFPGRAYYAAVAAIIPELYANSILVVLNARFQIAGGRATHISAMDIISAPNFLHSTSPHADVTGTRNNIGCSQVAISCEVFSDENFHEHIELKTMNTPHVGSRMGDVVHF
ncbi:hypothetical protein C8R44DRAFT_984473 [Mycena epipterygia]|nr:hypothetical protein C8R44DRAFT_984473 [Mycena epipterygia]